LDLHLDDGDEKKWIEELYDCMDRNDDAGVFRSFVQQILHSYRCHTQIQRVILFAALEGHEQGLARMHRQFAPVFERFMGYVVRRQSEGALLECDPHAILLGFGGIAHQYGMITHIFGAPIPDVSDEEMSQLFTRILLHGVHGKSAKDEDCKSLKPAEANDRKA